MEQQGVSRVVVGAGGNFSAVELSLQAFDTRMLDRRSNRFVPVPTHAQTIDRYCLSLIDGQASLGDIAEVLATSFPDDFSNVNEALNHVAELAGRYDQPGDGA